MSWIVSVAIFLGMAYSTYRAAKLRGEWSWPAFFWILGLLLVYSAAISLFVVATMAWKPDPALATALILGVIFVGIVPVAIVAKRIQRHYIASGANRRP